MSSMSHAPIFQVLYFDLARELEVNCALEGAELGSDEHMAATFALCKKRWCGTSHGEAPKNSRWWSFESRGAAFRWQKSLTL